MSHNSKMTFNKLQFSRRWPSAETSELTAETFRQVQGLPLSRGL
eukprot:SAG11_NODE_449_length_9392_cov_16.435381_12_plen_43_part_01